MAPRQHFLATDVAVLVVRFAGVANLTPSRSVIIEQGVHRMGTIRNTAQGTFRGPFLLLDFVKVSAPMGIHGLAGLANRSVWVACGRENKLRMEERKQVLA